MSAKRKQGLSVTVSEPAKAGGAGDVGGPGDDNNVLLSWEGVKAVQKKIERCLELYMTQAEIVTALQVQSNIEPSLTCLVWQKLLEQNPHFFHVYDYYLRMKDHVTAFNYLVEQQALIQNDLPPLAAGGPAAAAGAGAAAAAKPQKKIVVEIDITKTDE